MTAPNQYYVDPSIAASTGAGTLGDPWGDLQHALDTITRDTGDGDAVNIKAGTDEILTASLSLTSYGNPLTGAPLVFRGYTTAAHDNGVGVIDGNGNAFFTASATDALLFEDIKVHNVGAANHYSLDDQITSLRCEYTNGTSGGPDQDNDAKFIGNYVHDISGGDGCLILQGIIAYNFFENGTKDFTLGTRAADGLVTHNIYKLDGSSDAMRGQNHSALHMNNSVWSNAGTGEGVQSTPNVVDLWMNNVVEGFSGTGGDGYDFPTGGAYVFINNAAYNNTTNFNLSANIFTIRWGGTDENEVLAASAFTDATNGDFTPVDTGDMHVLLPNSYPVDSANNEMGGMWRGAVQPTPAGGGGGTSSILAPNIRGGYMNFMPGHSAKIESPWRPYIPVWLDTKQVLRTLEVVKDRFLLRNRLHEIGPRITDADYWHPITWQSRVHMGAWTRERSKRLAIQKQFREWERSPYGGPNGKEVWL